jgi:hypothetical protein
VEHRGARRPVRYQEVADRQAARRPQDVHGRPPRNGVPIPGCRDRTPHRDPRLVQTQVQGDRASRTGPAQLRDPNQRADPAAERE